MRRPGGIFCPNKKCKETWSTEPKKAGRKALEEKLAEEGFKIRI